MGFVVLLLAGLILAALVAALGLVWCASLGLMLLGLYRRSRILLWLGGVPLALSSVVGVAVGLLVAWNVARLEFLLVRAWLS